TSVFTSPLLSLCAKMAYDSSNLANPLVEKKIGRRFEKEIAVEEVNNKSIDVNDEDSDDDFVDSPFGSGLRRSGRNKNKGVCEPHNATTMASGSKEIGFGGILDFKVDGIPGKLGLYVVHNFDEHKMEIKLARGSLVITKELIGDMLGIKNEGIDILDGTPVRDNEMVRIWLEQYEDPKDIKPADVKLKICKSVNVDMNFKLNFIVLFTTIMGVIHYKRGTADTIDVWTAELLSEREADELCCGGFGRGDLEEDFVEEEEDFILTNLEGCVWMLNNYVANITKERKGFEKVLAAAENMFLGNAKLVGFVDTYMKCLKYTAGGNYTGTNETMQLTAEGENDVQEEAG
nr:hypothetical protein [Tanacetum cinerariifolium]